MENISLPSSTNEDINFLNLKITEADNDGVTELPSDNEKQSDFYIIVAYYNSLDLTMFDMYRVSWEGNWLATCQYYYIGLTVEKLFNNLSLYNIREMYNGVHASVRAKITRLIFIGSEAYE